jgi:hypothetical protein
MMLLLTVGGDIAGDVITGKRPLGSPDNLFRIYESLSRHTFRIALLSFSLTLARQADYSTCINTS